MTETTNQAGTVKETLGSDAFTTQTRYGAIQNQMRLSLTDRMEAHKMCLSFCYAGRNGHCASAGKDNRQVENCLALFRKKPLSGVCAA